MELSKKERLGFIYQLKILEKLYPEEASAYSEYRTALEEGFSLHYDWMAEQLSAEMSEADCKEVLDILDMYRAITLGLQKLAEGDDLQKHHLVKFRGFDGNNEPRQRSYVRYFVIDLDRYDELKDGDFSSFNSHTPMLDTYQAMLERWREIGNRFDLSRENIASVLGAE